MTFVCSWGARGCVFQSRNGLPKQPNTRRSLFARNAAVEEKNADLSGNGTLAQGHDCLVLLSCLDMGKRQPRTDYAPQHRACMTACTCDQDNYSFPAAGARVHSNGAASTSATTSQANGKQTVTSPRVNPAPIEPRFQGAGAIGRESPGVAQVALDPAATPLVDLNAATFEGGDPNRIRLADLIMNDGEAPPRSTSAGACVCATNWKQQM